MSSQGYTLPAGYPIPTNGGGARHGALGRVTSRRYWLHALLLLLTFLTTSAWGAVMAENFRLNQPAFHLERDIAMLLGVLMNPVSLLGGLPFSLTLMSLLLVHEFGHYLACRHYRVEASLPYFIPAPTIIGTFGAFIRIRSPIYSKQVLFDVGIAGPLAGFVVLLPALAIGLAFSKVAPGLERSGDLFFGIPPLVRLLQAVLFPGVAPEEIYLHPVARAAWTAIFSTALNLLPIGQLDGGHVLYAFTGRRHKLISIIVALGLIPLALFSGFYAWLFWAVIMLWLGLRHPPIFDSSQLSPGRRRLGYLALAMFLLCFMAAPVTTSAP